MRILVLTEEGDGEARIRERRESFDITEFRLTITCPNCKNEFAFNVEESKPIGPENQKPKGPPIWRRCPACNVPFKDDEKYPNGLVFGALSLYQAFYDFVCAYAEDLPLKLVVVTTPEPKA
jgi:hypothetical protein